MNISSRHPIKVSLFIGKIKFNALIGTGSSLNFIDDSVTSSLGLKVLPSNTNFFALPRLCADIILGLLFLSRHNSLEIQFGGSLSDHVRLPLLFRNLTLDVEPVATKSKKYNRSDQKFIDHELDRMLSKGIIEESISPWRAQIVLVPRKTGRIRLVVDLSRTINLNEISKSVYFSVLDLLEAYQIDIDPSERYFTAFEGNDQLYQFRKISMGIANGDYAFQRLTNIRTLGYEISHNMLRPDPTMFSALYDLKIPSNQGSLKRLLGFYAYYS
ncbi:hypothetical protein GJ496_005953 [Pomphorhynchus laevis]|nr:hypothetical protein GJ496_005953 [Pomphorhynchus laevis]